MTFKSDQAFITILRPVIKLLLKQGVDVAAFTALARSTYVQVAQDDDFALESATGEKRKISVSRIAMLTGINRKEVKALIENEVMPIRQSSKNRAVRVLNGWLTDKSFLGRDGEPRKLPYEDSGKVLGFESLVKIYSADTTPRVILDELIHVGSAVRSDGYVELVQKGYIPSNNDENMLQEGCVAINELATTVEYNLNKEKDSTSMLQLSVRYSDISVEGKKLFKSMLKSEANEFLAQQNKVLSSISKSNEEEVSSINANERDKNSVGVGLYYFDIPVKSP